VAWHHTFAVIERREAVRRLREHQLVTLQMDRPAVSIECLVLGIDGGEATLQPVYPSDLDRIPSIGAETLLTFEYRSQLVTLRGNTQREDATQDFRFAVTDRVTVPQRRRYARVDVALPVRLRPLNADGSAAGDVLETRTRDVSADGLLVEELLPPEKARWVVQVELPDDHPAMVCEANIVRHVGGGTGMRYTDLSAEDRQRLRDFVAARKRAILANLRKQNS
jgi:PilZ domain